MARVLFDHVRKQYGRHAPPVIRDLSLEVEDRELLVLVGPSGCGKSSALRMIAGLESISAGSLFIGERCVNEVAPKDRDVAMVFQSYALYPHMTCFENMGFALEVRGVRRDELRRRVLEAARALQIESILDRRPKELSGGQRQRVAIGRAIVRSPRVFLMDEPLSNLDAKLRSSMRAEVKRLHRELLTTIVYVTHDQTEAMTLGDRIAVLRAGDLLQLDRPERVYERPANAFVATFIGTPEMNLLEGRTTIEGGQSFAIGPGFRFALRTAVPGTDVLVGVRPEHLRAGDGPATFTGRVELVESTGTDSFVHLSTTGGRVVAKVDGVKPSAGENLTVHADLERIHLFDTKTEGRIE
jgi:multiple sugar transport system ATP-binding protein